MNKDLKQYIPLLHKTTLFGGIQNTEIEAMLDCLSVRIRHYKKNEYIFRCGDQIHAVGMVLTGLTWIEKEDFWGNRTILQEIMPGMIFAESYACLAKMPAEISVLASTDADIMFFDMNRILTVCPSACCFHSRLIQNMLSNIAKKNINLTKKIDYMSRKTIREKLLSYLSSESLRYGSPSFTIPFNRQELADYLSVDRSALSNELSKLQKEGILISHKNQFQILQSEM